MLNVERDELVWIVLDSLGRATIHITQGEDDQLPFFDV